MYEILLLAAGGSGVVLGYSAIVYHDIKGIERTDGKTAAREYANHVLEITDHNPHRPVSWLLRIAAKRYLAD